VCSVTLDDISYSARLWRLGSVIGPQGEAFDSPVRLDHTSDNNPSLCTVDGGLVLVWAGTDRHINIDMASLGLFGDPQRFEETSDDGPAICAIGKTLALAWTGADDHVNVAVFQDGKRTSKALRLDQTTFSACRLAG
jgi:hypothetical protein